MLPNEFKSRMQRLSEDYADDPEILHREADNLICQLLSDLGYGEGIDIYNKMDIWYA